jgi:hypothetical protein
MHPQEMRIAIVHIVLVKETGESAEIQARGSSKKVNHILRLAWLNLPPRRTGMRQTQIFGAVFEIRGGDEKPKQADLQIGVDPCSMLQLTSSPSSSSTTDSSRRSDGDAFLDADMEILV